MSIVWKITFRCHFKDNGTLIEPGVHVKTDDVPVLGELGANDVAARVWDHLGADFKNATTGGVRIDEVTAREEVIEPGAIGSVGFHSVDQDGNLGVTTWRLPLSMGALVDVHTDAASRSARGWIFMPPAEEATHLQEGVWATDSGLYVWTTAFADKLNDSFNQSGIDGRGYRFGVYSRTRRKRGQDPWFFPCTNATVKRVPAWLSSRLTTP